VCPSSISKPLQYLTTFETIGTILIGYARVSTNEQILDLQKDALEKIGCKKIYSDVVSGAKEERKGLQEALEYVREGDTLVVWRLALQRRLYLT
jgi:DNA invertase Pin-like site-specific DNA recombinase